MVPEVKRRASDTAKTSKQWFQGVMLGKFECPTMPFKCLTVFPGFKD